MITWWDILKHLPAGYKVLSRLNYKGDPEEMVHDVGIPIIARCLRGYDPAKGPFGSYLFPSLKNGFIAAMNVKRPGQHSLAGDPEDETINAELEHRDHVLYLLGGLDDYDRHLLVLYFWKGLTYEDLADTLGVGKSTVCNHVRRALARCRRRHNASERGSE